MATFKNLLFLLFGIFAVVSLTQSILQFSKNMKFYEAYKQEYEKEAKKNLELKTSMKSLQDVSEFEKIARDKLNLHKENEYVLIIPDPSPTPTPTIIINPPNYKLWWQTFIQGAKI